MRDIGVDIVRIVGLVAIVIGHVWDNETVRLYIYIWHVPIFFFLSGYFWKPLRSVRDELGNRTNSLLRPYLFWFCFVILFFVVKETVADSLSASELLRALLGGSYIGRPFSAFWFVTALVASALLFRMIEKFPVYLQIFVVIAAIVATYVWPTYVSILPWSLGIAFPALSFMYAGFFAARMNISPGRRFAIGVIFVAASLLVLALGLASPMDLKNADLGTPIVSICVSVFICCGITWIAGYLGMNLDRETSSKISTVNSQAITVVLMHALILYLLGTPSSGRYLDFFLALFIPLIFGFILVRTPLSTWVLGRGKSRILRVPR